MHALPVASNGTIDASALGIVWDTGLTGPQITNKAAYLANLAASIRTWETVSAGYGRPLTVANLNLAGTGPSKTFLILVGNGDHAPPPFKELKVSHVDTAASARKGYFFVGKDGSEGAHEFGHLIGLADRYFEVYSIANETTAGGRSSVPMAAMMFSGVKETGYDPATNLMSNDQAKNWTLSEAQLDVVFGATDETAKQRNVVAIENTSPTAAGGIYDLPASGGIVLKSDGNLYSGSGGTHKLAGYHCGVTTSQTPKFTVHFDGTDPLDRLLKDGIDGLINKKSPDLPDTKGGWVRNRKVENGHVVTKLGWVRDKIHHPGLPIHKDEMKNVSQLAR